MSNYTKSILRIFLSSTAIDMQEHRKKVKEAILRLGHFPVAMETFGSIPNEPVDVCRDKVQQSDALVVMVAYRYGWVPLKKNGGDGKKSITWIEVETAIKNKIPVFAYYIDKDFDWTQPKEQDQLCNVMNADEAIAISDKIKSLDEFKLFLQNNAGLTCDTFTTPNDLSLKVITSISNWIVHSNSSGNTLPSKKFEFTFRIVHPLQPAPHFCGRKQLLEDLFTWWHESGITNYVCSLVAIGGTGKTATVERFLRRIKDEKRRGSVLVWSFYEDPNIDAFLEEACLTFVGNLPEGVSRRLSYLQRVLESQNSQHLLVLDGLERIQYDGTGEMGYAKGELDGYNLKNLLRLIATGMLGNTRALITSRIKLTDLTQWEGVGYRNFNLDVLEKMSAIEVLKAWSVKGSQEQLSQIAQSVGCHALSVSVLGSYLKNYCNGDPDGVKDFKLDEISSDEPLAAKLNRILAGYAKSLAIQERDLLVRLSVFPKGVSIDILEYLSDAGGEIAGALCGADKKKILSIANRLHRLGLVYSYERADSFYYTAHPFLRLYFRQLLGVKPEAVHETIRKRLAEGLDHKPSIRPVDLKILDKYEMLIEHNILAGCIQDAFNLFYNVMGGGGTSDHILHHLGDYERIMRISKMFSTEITTHSISVQLSDEHIGYLITQKGWAAEAHGDLQTADTCFQICIKLARNNNYLINLAQMLQNRAVIALQKGHYPSAKNLIAESLEIVDREYVHIHMKKTIQIVNNGFLAIIMHETGEISKAKYRFQKATKMNGESLHASGGLYEVEHLNALGEKTNALKRIKDILTISEENTFIKDIYRCHYWFGMLVLPESVNQARTHLQKIRTWTELSGYMECIIYSYILSSEITFHLKDYSGAISEAETGLKHAVECGFGKLTIVILILLSKVNFAAADYSASLEYAKRSLQKSQNSDCCNAWGEADSYFLCGMCYKYLKERDLAINSFIAALTIQEKIQHPKRFETISQLYEFEVHPKKNTL